MPCKVTGDNTSGYGVISHVMTRSVAPVVASFFSVGRSRWPFVHSSTRHLSWRGDEWSVAGWLTGQPQNGNENTGRTC
ncbi:hypothetical protein ACOMHN_064461 [Nucella lapillus]